MSHRKLAVITGTLLILGVVTALIAAALTDPALSAEGFIGQVSSHSSRILLAAFFQLVTGLGAAAIAVSVYPVLMKSYPALAIGAIGFRVAEGAFYAIAGLGLIALLALGRSTGVGGGGEIQLIANAFVDIRDASYFVFGVAAFGIGATLYYIGFYLTRLVPRWLTSWGIAGMALIVVTALVTLFDGAPYAVTGSMQILAVPIAVQELVLGIWLIARGYRVPEQT